MKQKLGIAQAIMENQDILILDEPFNALDYKTCNDIKEIIRILQAEGRTILMTSHNYDIEVIEHKTAYMAQAKQIAEAVCDEQSLKVDAISGATLTSDTVLKAIENALGKTESFE